MSRRTGPGSWLLAHVTQAARMLWDDLATIAAYYRKPKLPQRQRQTPPEWRLALPTGHPDYWCSLSTVHQQEWDGISKNLGIPPAVPQPRREHP